MEGLILGILRYMKISLENLNADIEASRVYASTWLPALTHRPKRLKMLYNSLSRNTTTKEKFPINRHFVYKRVKKSEFLKEEPSFMLFQSRTTSYLYVFPSFARHSSQ